MIVNSFHPVYIVNVGFVAIDVPIIILAFMLVEALRRIAIRRWRRPAEAADFGQPTASVTRWRITVLPATPLPVPGVGRPRWQLELIRCRAGESADFEVEACDAKGRLALPSNPVHGAGATDIGRRRTAG